MTLTEIEVEGATVADEIRDSPAHPWVTSRLDPSTVPLWYVPQEDLKRSVGAATFVVRTGETTPYANVLLRCGVPF